MKTEDRKIISEFKRKLPPDLLIHVKKVIAFGSRARGEGTEDSDLDLMVLVDERTEEIEKRLDDIAYEVMWDYDFKPIVSLKVFGETQFRSAVARGFSFYKHVEKEGISV